MSYFSSFYLDFERMSLQSNNEQDCDCCKEMQCDITNFSGIFSDFIIENYLQVFKINKM